MSEGPLEQDGNHTPWNDPYHNGWLDPGQPVVAQAPPPATQFNTGPVGAGGPNQLWVDGHYEWNNGQYQWIDGHWGTPPQPGWAWQQPAWHNGRWHRGHWHAQNAQIDPVYSHSHGQWNPGWHGQPTATPVAQPVSFATGQSVAVPAGGAVAQPVGGSVSVQGSFNAGVNAGGPVATPVR